MLSELKQAVLLANKELAARKIVLYTWGNVSGIDREKGLMVIKPSGVPYEELTEDDMVVVDVETGQTVEENKNPSTDTPTHLALYRAWPDIGGVTHTHSAYAAAFAQAGKDIPPLGTTHADYFYGSVPCTGLLSPEDVATNYEANTGRVIIDTFRQKRISPTAIPGVLVRDHGPFTWGKSAAESVYHAVVLEETARMACLTLQLGGGIPIPSYILDKHYERKHGKNAYYGQRTK